jgi:C-terminal processing protease CtpA/Prc
MTVGIKKLPFIFIVVAAVVGCGTRPEPKQYADYSQSSGFVVTNADSVNVENLEVLAKVWGFAKYHHPVFADSIHNIDYELFELLPRVAYAGKDERNAVLSAWIDGLGKFKSAEKELRSEIAKNDYTSPSDWEWLENETLLSVELSEKLQRLRWAKRTTPSRYAYITGYGYVSFDAESGAGPDSSDTGYDLLTLFRLWNMAEYYFPSVNITDKKWSGVLPEYILKFLTTADNEVKWTTAELITELSDTHSVMRNNPVYGGYKLPVEFGFVEGKLIVTDNRKFLSEGEEPMFQPGDEIVSIDGYSPDYFVERARKYMAASNENVLLKSAADIANYLKAEVQIPIVVRKEKQQIRFNIAAIPVPDYYGRRNEWLKGKASFELLNYDVGYLYAGKFKNADGEDIMKSLADTKAIIVDMRCYPSDFMPFDFIGRYFVPEPVQHVFFTKAVGELPGYFVNMPESLGYTNNGYYKGMVVVLVNETTLSQAEYTTMAFQASPNCVVVGSQTAGADGNVVTLPLPSSVKTLFSGLGVFYPDGTNAQRAGVRIDHYVTPTIEGIRAGRDEVLEKALEIIENQ